MTISDCVFSVLVTKMYGVQKREYWGLFNDNYVIVMC